MSTAVIEAPVSTLPALGGAVRTGRARGGRPRHLQLVPTRPGSAPARPGSTRVQETAPAPTACTGGRDLPLRITRRGRLALTGTATVVVTLVVLSLMGLLGPAGATTSVVVQPGMTLSQIATEQLPDVPLSKAVTDIQRANRLSTTSIAAGQELVIPGR